MFGVYDQVMMPTPEESPWSPFDGIEYNVHFRGPPTYDSERIVESVTDSVRAFLTDKGMSNRRGFRGGLGAAATGGMPFYDFLLWLQEHWELAAAGVSAVFAGLTRLRVMWSRTRVRFQQRALDPYKPALIVELCVRASAEGEAGQRQAAQSFYSLLPYMPALNHMLRNKWPDFGSSIRVLTAGSPARYPYVYFKVRDLRDADVVRIIRFLERATPQSGVSAVLLYRRFGLWTKVVSSGDGKKFMELTMRSES